MFIDARLTFIILVMLQISVVHVFLSFFTCNPSFVSLVTNPFFFPCDIVFHFHLHLSIKTLFIFSSSSMATAHSIAAVIVLFHIISVPTFFRGEGAEIALNLYQKFPASP